ncbi:MAG: group II intron maturase-specific domain-containing protein [Pseudonocardia sp.]
MAFLPAISPQALKKISLHVRRWRLHRWIYHTFAEIARTINPVVAGWMQYYGRFYPSVLYRLLASHQRLPGALDPQQVPTPRRDPRRARQARGNHLRVSPHVLVLALGHDRLLTRVTSPVT